ncbi:MAG TPA: TIR domain-containing protein [Candidatus Binatia bacterium]
MADIFISYASEDRERARALAETLGAHGWSVWWDREIPLGKSFDEVIEKALASAKCVVVLWSAVSVASEWVRNEASEGKRRGILVPVFIEPVDAPLAFRLLNGADLRDWSGAASDAEFARLVERVTELLAQTGDDSLAGAADAVRVQQRRGYKNLRTRRPLTPLIIVVSAIAVVGAGVAGYLLKGDRPEPQPEVPTTVPATDPGIGTTDMEKRIRDLVGTFGGAIPATSLAKGFHVPDLGMRMAFLSPEQSASTLGAMPAGAVVMEIESGRPMAKAGLHVGDVVLSIGGKKIASEDDLRQAIFKIGPGKTQYSYRRSGDIKTVAVDCPNCKVE